MADYQLRSFSFPADLEDLLTAELWSLGSLGFEVHAARSGRRRLDAYFPIPLPPALESFRLAAWEGRGVRLLKCEALADRDWLAAYRAGAEPFDVGRGLRVDPRDPPACAEPAGGRVTLKIPARTAFGTGSHESTRLVLEWLEDLDLTGASVLDVGTGSGVLSLAALLLGAARAVGCDVDAQAVCIARGNGRTNGLQPALFAGGVIALGPAARFDLVVVNILPENIAGERRSIAAHVSPRGRLLSSGNLASRRGELLAGWARCGLVLEEARQEAEWVAFLLRQVDQGADAGDLVRGRTGRLE